MAIRVAVLCCTEFYTACSQFLAYLRGEPCTILWSARQRGDFALQINYGRMILAITTTESHQFLLSFGKAFNASEYRITSIVQLRDDIEAYR